MPSKGLFYVGFADMREARLACARMHQEEPAWKVDSIARDSFRKNTYLTTQPPRSFEDTVQVNLYCGPESTVDRDNVDFLLRSVLELVGPVHSIWVKKFNDTPHRLKRHQLYVRFFQTQHAMNAAKAVNAGRNTVCFIPYFNCFRSELTRVFQDFIVEAVPWAADVDDEVRHWAAKTSGAPKPRVQKDPKDPYGSPGQAGQDDATPVPGRGCDIDDARIVCGLETRTTVSSRFPRNSWMADI